MKKALSIILLLLSLCGESPAGNQDFLFGEVLALDEKNLMVRLKTTGNDSGGQTVLIGLHKDLLFHTQSGILRLPGCLTVGNYVRFWGKHQDTGNELFLATEVRGCGRQGCGDPTGVRSRLMQEKRQKTAAGG